MTKNFFIYLSFIFLIDGRIFVTIIRNDGVPSSLNVISEQKGPGGPLLQPYPDWTWTKRGDCNGITSVYRVAVSLFFFLNFFITIYFLSYILILYIAFKYIKISELPERIFFF